MPGEVIQNEGQRLLVESGWSLTDVSKQLHIRKQAVSHWRHGKATPDHKHRVALQAMVGIPVEAWEQLPKVLPKIMPPPPKGTTVAYAAPAAQPTYTVPVAAPPVPVAAPAPPTPPPPPPKDPPLPPKPRIPKVHTTTLDEVNQLIDNLRQYSQNVELLPAAVVRLADSEAKLLALKARLEEKQEMLEERIVKEHPFWRKIRRALLDALQPYPEAAKDVAEALRRLDA